MPCKASVVIKDRRSVFNYQKPPIFNEPNIHTMRKRLLFWLLALMVLVEPFGVTAQERPLNRSSRQVTSTCVAPSSMGAFRITHNSSLLSWSNDDTMYRLKVSTSLMNDLTATADVADSLVYDFMFQLENLTAAQTYYYYIQSVCEDDSVSSWSSSSFTTLCEPASVPYREGFEDYGTGVTAYPNCWTQIRQHDGDWGTVTPATSYWPYCDGSYRYNGGASLRMYAYYYNQSSYISARTTQAYAVAPQIDVDSMSNYQISFWLYAANTNYKLHVGVMDDAGDVSRFEELASVSCSKANSWQEFIIPLASTHGGKYVAFMVDATDDDQTVTMYIDDVMIEEIPNCAKGSGLGAQRVRGSSAEVTWMGTAPAWHIKVSSYQINPETTIGDIVDETVVGNSKQITGLNENTTDYFYVQSDCGVAGPRA